MENSQSRKKLSLDKVTYLYLFFAMVFLVASHVYGVLSAEELIAETLSGPVVSWVHFLTLGFLLPVVFALAVQKLRTLYGQEPEFGWGWKIHFISYYAALPFYLYFIYSKTETFWLFISGITLFVSSVMFVILYWRKLGQIPKEGRDKFHFRMDIIIGFFILQTTMFGALLVSNLHFGWFFSENIHSIRIHSHSGILAVFIPMILLYLDVYDSGKTIYNKMLRLSAGGFVFFVFLWTAVHDKNPVVFQAVFYGTIVCALLSVLYVFGRALRLDKHNKLLLAPFLFLLVSVLLAAELIIAGDRPYTIEKNMALQYGFATLYGVFVASFSFLIRKVFIEKELGGKWSTIDASIGFLATLVVVLSFYFSNANFLSGGIFVLLLLSINQTIRFIKHQKSL